VRQLVFHGPRRLAVEDAGPVEPAPGEILVQVHSVGVCGSDVHGYAGVNARRQPGMIMGHEVSGVVTELGAGVSSPAVGTAVAVNPIVSCGECAFCREGNENVCERRQIYGCVPALRGAYADTFAVRAQNAVPFEGDAPLEWGALAEPLSVGARAARVGDVRPGTEALVVGGGPIGIAAALAARRRGADRVVISEPLEHRRQIAEELGFETIDPHREETPRSAFPVTIECVGHSETVNAALEAVRPRGTMVFVGLAEETVEVHATPLMVGERVIRGSAAYAMDDFQDVTSWIASAEVDLSRLIELRVDLDGLSDVFDRYADGELQAMKTLLQPTG
jgi:2-desacetyl-2-hydroxyethyl bacteriochlorophyllide A dehydrogenase